MIAINVSATATPIPDTNPERRFLLNVRCMHNTATGPTVMDEAKPTHIPRKSISKVSINIVCECVFALLLTCEQGLRLQR